MRVISGIAKGRTLLGPKSHDIRPALDKVKQAVFNILGNILGDSTDTEVLDLFAGTGSIGIEAISRGAKKAVFVDAGQEALTLIHKNVELCRFESQAVILKRKIPLDLPSLAKKNFSFDLIFVDPPYDKGLVNPTLRKIAELQLLKPEGLIVVEHSSREIIHEIEGLTLSDQRQYGQTWISFLK